MNRVSASKIFYIKLGEKGEWEKDCIEKEHTMKIGYTEISHADCLRGNWNKIRGRYLALGRGKSTATRFANELQHFYEVADKTLWFTFYLKKLWWCFGSEDITFGPKGTKIRKVCGRWHDEDINGSKLFTDVLNGELASKQGYRGTMFELSDQTRTYLVNRINGKESESVTRARNAEEKLLIELTSLIQGLHWRDFETLVDLVFRQQGFQRLSSVGGTTKDIDLDLFAPVTGQRCMVQIKSESGNKEFQDYCNKFEGYKDYAFCYFVVHRPKDIQPIKSQRVKLLLAPNLADLVLDVGLIGWLMKKSI